MLTGGQFALCPALNEPPEYCIVPYGIALKLQQISFGISFNPSTGT